MHGDTKVARSLYRTALREIRRLPIEYLRQFFRLKVGDDVRGIFDAKLESVQASRTKRVQSEVRNLQRANHGHVNAFQHVMQTAYGRRGRLKWEILRPLRTGPGAQPPPPIIPVIESSRPPVWSSEIMALVTSDISRKKALKADSILVPPTIPKERLDPQSTESQTLGPFSKRREVNARWKFFQHQLDKTLFPLQITLHQRTEDNKVTVQTDQAALMAAGARGIGLQGAGVFEELEALSSPPGVARLEASSAQGDRDDTRQVLPTIRSHLPRRFLRRRFQETLAQIPVLAYTLPSGRYKVTLSPSASTRNGPIQSVVDETDLAWLERAKMGKGGG
ncbi:hypothetical protein GSI_06433 [Ganoderma sinense ZZ0214-1]|uniref:LYR motif-containing protein Cup1-like N-terminal domain-containing protein n=1 Tax=Ganoderma sinense ZZ0214-1 TaxID=1077348 RepID=A0A2G8SD92_9APHY|nr:hypothetical protein GSI_06433 [Ganoderma sinense ZZ0214-1]